MARYLRPGAYHERVDAARTPRVLLRSGVPGFVGIAEHGPLDVPVPVESFRQFQAVFGGCIGAGFLAYAVRAFFDNGGRRCWVVRVANRVFDGETGWAARAAALTLHDTEGRPLWRIEAFSEGTWGNELEVALLEENTSDTQSVKGGLQRHFAEVVSTAGFRRGTLVRISQDDGSGTVREALRVVCHVDETARRLYWVHPEAGAGLPSDRALDGFDAGRTARLVSVSYQLQVYRRRALVALYDGLSLVPGDVAYGPTRLPHYVPPAATNPGDVQVPAPVVIRALHEPTGIPTALQMVPLERLALRGGQDGLAALSPRDFIGEEIDPEDSEQVRLEKTRGLAALQAVAEITLLAAPDAVLRPEPELEYPAQEPPPRNPCLPCPPAPEPVRWQPPKIQGHEQPPIFTEEQTFLIQAAMVAQCESRGDRFALIDPPFHCANDATAGLAATQAWRQRFDTTYAALYYPWVKVIDPRVPGAVRALPPSGHVLGQYALFDGETGVHRAPANRALRWIQDLSLHTSFGQQEVFNPIGINVLRSEGSRGIRVMGARTLSSDPDWRYVNVRRLLISIRRAIDVISQWVVFEPNDEHTRNKFQVALASYLETLWSRGALVGATREAAFFVKCDEENNPASQRDQGQLLAEIGVAPTKPYEFVVVRVGVQDNELTFSESNAVQAI
jgi:Phage tail sheath protein FI